MNKLIFYSSKNTHGKKDSSGAFRPEAKAFAKFYNVPSKNVVGIDCTAPKKERKIKVFEKLSKVDDIELLMFFGHGWPQGIQFGFNRSDIDELAASINFVDGCKIGIFACLTAENDTRDNNISGLGAATDGGFADMLRDSLNFNFGWTGWIDAHKTAGHTTWNPYAVRFVAGQNFGGQWIISPDSPLWKKWVKALHKNSNNIRYNFLTMTQKEIIKSLESI